MRAIVGVSKFAAALAVFFVTGCALSHRATVDGGPTLTDGFDSVDGNRHDAMNDGPCPDGSLVCDGVCFGRTESAAHCGTCANDCTALPNVRGPAATCGTGGVCVIHDACQPGYADCNNDPRDGCERALGTRDDCSACGDACSGATPVCSTSGGVSSCTNGCMPGMENCSGMCAVLATDPQNCGACGRACANVPNGSVSCVGGSCVTACDSGFHDCGGNCVSNTSVSTCGSSCTPCTAGSNAMPVCDGTSCGSVCIAGFHDCSGTCVSDLDPSTCGTRCTPCPGGSNATPSCDGTNCGLACATGYHLCGGACVGNTDPAHCGGLCSPCPAAPANGTVTCNGTTCGFSCNLGYMASGTSCVAMPSTCGNRALESGEECDDGNTSNGDGCHGNCTIESGVAGQTCGGPSLIVISSAGTVYFTGDTTGAGNDYVTTSTIACPANAPDRVYRIQFNTGAPFRYSIAVTPSGGSSWNVVLISDTNCPMNFCANATTSGTETAAYGFANTTTLQLLVDGAAATDYGPFVMRIDTSIP